MLCFIISSCEKRNFDNLEDRDTPNYFSNMLYDPNSQVLFFQNQESFSKFMSIDKITTVRNIHQFYIK